MGKKEWNGHERLATKGFSLRNPKKIWLSHNLQRFSTLYPSINYRAIGSQAITTTTNKNSNTSIFFQKVNHVKQLRKLRLCWQDPVRVSVLCFRFTKNLVSDSFCNRFCWANSRVKPLCFWILMLDLCLKL